MNKKSVYRNQEKTSNYRPKAFRKSEKCFRNLRWHFAKVKNASAICAGILQK